MAFIFDFHLISGSLSHNNGTTRVAFVLVDKAYQIRTLCVLVPIVVGLVDYIQGFKIVMVDIKT